MEKYVTKTAKERPNFFGFGVILGMKCSVFTACALESGGIHPETGESIVPNVFFLQLQIDWLSKHPAGSVSTVERFRVCESNREECEGP
jgi:hypothetical protein